MKIITASLAGFCFGVDAAVKKLNKLIEEKKGTKIYTLGKLIHNPQIIAELESKGVCVISPDDIDRIAKKTDAEHPSAVVIRAHGISRQVTEKLIELSQENSSFEYIDCTCPRVKKIHDIVMTHSSADTLTLIFGNKNHPEVEGICSYAAGEAIVFSDVNELDLVKLNNKKVILVSQTTQNLSEWKKSQKFIKRVCTNSLIFDTICSVTENRQTEADLLSKKVDLMLVIGGRDSSNTNKLYDICRGNQRNTFFIESPDDLPFNHVTAHIVVGIAAGASTPGSIIEEVKTKMSEIDTQKNDSEALDFAEMLEQSFKTLNTGDTVTGIVTQVNGNEVHVDLGTKVTGIIPASDIVDPTVKLTDLYHVGDEVTAVAFRVSDVDGVATLSRRKIEGALNWQKILDAYNEGTILEGKVTEIVKSGVIIILNSVKVFIPASHTGLPKDADLEVLLGTMQRVKIIDINEQRKHAVASIRVVAREERKAAEDAVWSDIEVGRHYTGTVKSLTSYGAFVDIGGVDGMVHVSELSWKRIKNPAEVVKVGDTLDVFVLDLDREKKRISLGYKTAESDPWNAFINRYAIGDEAEVKIVSMMKFGAFAEVVPGVDGLIHISQIADKRIESPAEVLKVGEVVNAKITDIDTENRKISLSIRALLEAEKEEAEGDEVVYSDDAAEDAE